MKKRSLKTSLRLNKKNVSNLTSNELKGGTGSVYCSVSCDPFSGEHSCKFEDCFPSPQTKNFSCENQK